LLFGIGTERDVVRAGELLEELYRREWTPSEIIHEPGCVEALFQCSSCCRVPPRRFQDPDLVYLLGRQCWRRVG
jgi:hypothetical protein